MTEIAKFLRKLRIDSSQNLGDMAERLFAHDLAQINRTQLAEVKEPLQRIKAETTPT